MLLPRSQVVTDKENATEAYTNEYAVSRKSKQRTIREKDALIEIKRSANDRRGKFNKQCEGSEDLVVKISKLRRKVLVLLLWLNFYFTLRLCHSCHPKKM